MIGEKIRYLYRQHSVDGIVLDKLINNKLKDSDITGNLYLVECGNEVHIVKPEDISQILNK